MAHIISKPVREEELLKSPQEARVAVLSLRTERKTDARMVMLLLMMKWRSY